MHHATDGANMDDEEVTAVLAVLDGDGVREYPILEPFRDWLTSLRG
jgi:hypothetical protein